MIIKSKLSSCYFILINIIIIIIIILFLNLGKSCFSPVSAVLTSIICNFSFLSYCRYMQNSDNLECHYLSCKQQSNGCPCKHTPQTKKQKTTLSFSYLPRPTTKHNSYIHPPRQHISSFLQYILHKLTRLKKYHIPYTKPHIQHSSYYTTYNPFTILIFETNNKTSTKFKFQNESTLGTRISYIRHLGDKHWHMVTFLLPYDVI